MLHVTLGDRADSLADLLARRLSDTPPDPFAPEWVVVGSIGMRRWLSQFLARRLGCSPGRTDGVVANISFPFPSQLRRALTGPVDIEAVDPWHVDSLQFFVLSELEALGMKPELGRAHRMARLLDRYHHRRHEMIVAWADGRPLDGAGGPLPVRHRWQYELWHRVRERIDDRCDDPSVAVHPAARLTSALHALREDRAAGWPAPLPHRLFVVGLNHATPDLLDIVSALSVGGEVDVMWLSSSIDVTRAAVELGRRDGARPPVEMFEPLSMLARHPLAVSWGSAAREGAVLLGARTTPDSLETATPDRSPRSEESTLDVLHSDIAADVPPTRVDREVTPQRITLHACAGPTRQAEVARDAIRHLLADDADLAERDIAVICPDVDRFAAPVRAAFGPPGEILEYRIISRAAPLANERANALLAALELVGGRVTAGQVMSLLASGAVRERFGFGHDDLSTIGRWVDELAVRWGLDGPRREPFGVPASFTHNTWLRAVRSLMLGIALDPDDDVDPVPLAIEGSDVSLAGRLAEVIELLSLTDEEFSDPAPWPDWADRLRQLDASLSASPTGREWEAERLEARLTSLERAGTVATGGDRADVDIDVADLRIWLSDELGGGSSAARIGDGSIPVCSPSVLRSVPFRAVVLMGLDQTAAGARSGDDLVAASPQLGDPDHRLELRQQLLDAVMATSDHLVITYDAVDPASGQEVPSSTLLDELTECLGHMGLVSDPAPGCVVHHARLAVAEKEFEPAEDGSIWSFDEVSLRGALAARTSRGADPLQRIRSSTLERERGELLGVTELVTAVTNAPQAFAQQTLGVDRGPDESGSDDDLTLSLDGLTRWSLGQQVLDHRLSRSPAPDPFELWSRRGRLPVGTAGEVVAADIADTADELIAAARGDDLVDLDSTTVTVDVTVGSGRHVVGLVPGVGGDDVLRHVGFSTLSAKHLLSSWTRLLVLCSADPRWHRATVVGRNKNKARSCHLRVRGDDPRQRQELAVEHLGALDDLHRRAASAVLPLVAATSFAMGRSLSSSDSGARATWAKEARSAWVNFEGYGDSTDRWVSLFFDGVDFDDIWDDPTARELSTELVARIDATVELDGDHDFGPAR